MHPFFDDRIKVQRKEIKLLYAAMDEISSKYGKHTLHLDNPPECSGYLLSSRRSYVPVAQDILYQGAVLVEADLPSIPLFLFISPDTIFETNFSP